MSRRLFLIAAHLFLILSTSIFAGTARDQAMKAYHLMEESPFDSRVFQESISLIDSAYESDPNEPWIYIASSLAIMQRGYKIGSWYSHKSFRSGAIDKALQFAEKAKQLGKTESQAYAHLARILIIKNEYRKAWDLLNKSHQLDNNNYYAWFYKALIYYYMKGYDDSLPNLDEAEKHITHRYQKKLITRQRQRVARKQGNKVLEEKMYKKNIEDFPENAYMYGNYASFLLNNDRPRESVIYYEKAISIKPYPKAIEKLEEAKRKAGMK